MSGIEVAGLILGALPILIDGLASYRKGLKSLRRGFQRRKLVEELTCTLTVQVKILEELLRFILNNSGYETPETLSTKSLEILRDSDVQNAIARYLGPNYEVITEAMLQCQEIFYRIITSISKLVPSLKERTELSQIIEANKNAKRGQLDLVARISLIFVKDDLGNEIKELESRLNSMQRLVDLMSSNTQFNVANASLHSRRMAKAYMRIRNQADMLYLALANAWISQCHQNHDARLLLEDRVEEIKREKRLSSHDGKERCFQLIFSGGSPSQNTLWHESQVHVIPSSDGEEQHQIPPTSSKVKIPVPISKPTARSSRDIKDICSAIEEGRDMQEHAIFALIEGGKITADTSQKRTLQVSQAKGAVFLGELLRGNHNLKRNTSPKILYRPKLSLALNLAASFLQVLRTPWACPMLSKENIMFLEAEKQELDVKRPFLSLSFGTPQANPASSNNGVALKEELVELGIVLLEVWHETTLEEARASIPGCPKSIPRRFSAIQWFQNSTNDAYPEAYRSALEYCLVSSICLQKEQKWDDPELWRVICESVVVPLAGILRT
ncbi:hypothetical protein PV08_10756 [Exophiala spinifera]|uniref:DUF7580 domain-containing protein n=1 Tax=Exophiala spinifera TaxID=91928 RepID=A0A0D1Y908_9EURO|nr:uncharacterized protein PV08_10756 [Exophiala spinifera]KIW11456.1 hypothetical protein PV08_10756 [Exophiala spinifera]